MFINLVLHDTSCLQHVTAVVLAKSISLDLKCCSLVNRSSHSIFNQWPTVLSCIDINLSESGAENSTITSVVTGLPLGICVAFSTLLVILQTYSVSRTEVLLLNYLNQIQIAPTKLCCCSIFVLYTLNKLCCYLVFVLSPSHYTVILCLCCLHVILLSCVCALCTLYCYLVFVLSPPCYTVILCLCCLHVILLSCVCAVSATLYCYLVFVLSPRYTVILCLCCLLQDVLLSCICAVSSNQVILFCIAETVISHRIYYFPFHPLPNVLYTHGGNY